MYRVYVDLDLDEHEVENMANRFDAVIDAEGIDAEFNYVYMEK